MSRRTLAEADAEIRALRAKLQAAYADEERATQDLEAEVEAHKETRRMYDEDETHADEIAIAEALRDRAEHAYWLARDRALGIATTHHAAPLWSEQLSYKVH